MSLVQQLAQQAKDSIPQGTLSVDAWIETYNQEFAKLVIEHIIGKIEQESEIAWSHEQGYAHATLVALGLEILEDFDMEMPNNQDLE